MFGFGYTGIIASMKKLPSGGGNGALTTAWITATGETDTTIISALNTLETDLTTYGLTAKIKALYPMVGGTAAKHKFNFMDARDLDAAFRLTFNGGWTHDSNGALPNGTNGYANTYLNPVTTLTNYNAHQSVYCRLDGSSVGFDIGVTNSPGYTNEFMLSSRRSNIAYSALYDYLNPNGQTSASSITSAKGLTLGSITSNVMSKLYKNATLLNTNTLLNISTPSSYPLYIGALNDKNTGVIEYTSNQYALISLGNGLSDTEAANFYTAVQAFQTTLSRQV